MGTYFSKTPPVSQTPLPVFEKTWRQTGWSMKEQMVNKLRKFPMEDTKLGQFRILLIGPIGAGKSSFLNSVKSVFAGHVVLSVLADSITNSSFTKKYETYRIKDGKINLPFTFSDVMGLESDESRGVHTDDIIGILNGHIPEDYKFNPSSPMEITTEMRDSSELSEKIHCLVNVVSTNTLFGMSDKTKLKMRTIRETASQLGIPQIVVMTMVDKICPEVARDLRNIYLSKAIKKKMEMCSNELGVPMNCIFPVKNYHEESELNNDMDVLVLKALTVIVDAAHDYIRHVIEKQ